MLKECAVLCIISSMIWTIEAFKVLLMFPLPAPSHGILGNGYVEHLLNAGHEVTYITPFPREDPPPNLHQVVLNYPDEVLPSKILNIENILSDKQNINLNRMMHFFFNVHEHALRHENVQKLMTAQNENFDVAVIEWLYGEVSAGFAALFQCPLIWSSSVDPHWLILQLVDEAANPSYVPDILSNNLPPFTFSQRVQELWTQISTSMTMKSFDKKYTALYNEVFVPAGNRKGILMPPYEEVKYNASLVISNSHVSLGEPVRLPQNFIPVGGYHIDTKPKPLPKDLQKLMDDARNGVIYFSMGSNLKSKDLPDKMKRDFLETFGQLNQTVIWKFEDALSGLPKNVHILKWAPQQSILAHPNCILFITHGGLLSTTETVHFGVPIVGIPVFADQFINVDKSVSRGFAKRVDLSHETPKRLKVAIHEVIGDPSYREMVKYLSMVYHDRPVPPGRLLVHCGARGQNPRRAASELARASTPWYHKTYLDLAALIAAVTFGLYITAKCLFNSIFLTYDNKKNQ
ncbi:Ecdysteroid UDP-glucosyltransferase [Eumeta japonica]|uniref:UDP-glucuronosyltransferase n=1 Tax=Eumeta variegata TaxID=151549 RepID=A0A4C1VW77_EUMVA|nr:Ecdysteroid UDP-glucosyltransferase [Eumeta japonica]